jgi:mRNA-degrading endonuclease RelE of RelBE toxin-antitoxin system
MLCVVSAECKKMLAKVPVSTSKLFNEHVELLASDTRDHRLHVKKLKGEDDVYSFRVTRAYRALFFFQDSKTIIVFALGHRKDIYK